MTGNVVLAGILAADSLLPRFVIGVVVGGAVGALIGNTKDRMGLGLILGALLGCLGWLIIALIPRKSSV